MKVYIYCNCKVNLDSMHVELIKAFDLKIKVLHTKVSRTVNPNRWVGTDSAPPLVYRELLQIQQEFGRLFD